MRKGTIIGIFLLAFCLACRLFVPVADIYAVHIYPAVSYVLSLAGSIFPFSLEEIVVLGFVTAFVIKERGKQARAILLQKSPRIDEATLDYSLNILSVIIPSAIIAWWSRGCKDEPQEIRG